MTIETDNEKSVAYLCYPAGSHDNIQYHFFCGKRFFSIRIFRTKSLERHFVWLYDKDTQEIFNSSENIHQKNFPYLSVKSENLSIIVNKKVGEITVYSGSKTIIHINFKVASSFTYLPTKQTEPVTHLPDLSCTVSYRNEILEGIGYCKRYFGEYPAYWNYRFVHSVTPPFIAWSADALFGENKYNYFHFLPKDGSLISNLNGQSSVSGHLAQSTILNESFQISFQRIASWEARLNSNAMDSLLQQHYCKATLKYNEKTIEGFCLNESCTGSLA